MASDDPNPAPFDDEDDDIEDTDGDDTDIDDDEEAPPLPPPSTTAVDFAPDPIPPPQNGSISAVEIVSDLKRPRIEERRPSAVLDESRRLFQRLWTDDDEIKILTGFLEFTSSRGTQFASHQYDTGPFYEQIKNQLQLDFNKNQLIEKLRRLKKKYRNTASRMANQGNNFTFKSPHEKETYEIAKKIWPPSIKRSKESDEEDLNPYSNRTVLQSSSSSRSRRRRSRKRSLDSLPAEIAAPAMLALPQPPPPPPPLPTPPPAAATTEGVFKVEVQTALPAVVSPVVQNAGVVEETVKSCLSPFFKELLNSVVNAPFGLGVGVNLPPLLNFGGDLGSLSSDERWKKQQILELEVYLKRVELIRDQVKSMLEELRASQ